MERAIQLFAALNFGVIGLSHVVQHRMWAEFFIRLRGLGRAGVFANAMLSLLFGSIIVAFHNVWTGPAIVLTVIGWAQVAKGLLHLTVPRAGERGLNRVSLERSWEFAVAGVVLLIVGSLQVYLLLQG